MVRLSGAARRAQLLAVAREEFLRVGPEGARISDIADRAEVNVALIYRHFESKEQLFEAAIVDPLESLLRDLLSETADLAREEPVLDTVLSFYRTLLQIFTQTLGLFGVVLFSDRASGHDFYQRRIAPFIDALVEIQTGAGALWPQVHDPAVTTPMCVGMCWGATMDAHFRDTELDIDRVAETLAAVTAYGLLGPTTN